MWREENQKRLHFRIKWFTQTTNQTQFYPIKDALKSLFVPLIHFWSNTMKIGAVYVNAKVKSHRTIHSRINITVSCHLFRMFAWVRLWTLKLCLCYASFTHSLSYWKQTSLESSPFCFIHFIYYQCCCHARKMSCYRFISMFCAIIQISHKF